MSALAGSMADVPRDFVKEIEQLEKMFTVDTAKLKEITDHFVKELTKGLTVEGGSIVSLGHRLGLASVESSTV